MGRLIAGGKAAEDALRVVTSLEHDSGIALSVCPLPAGTRLELTTPNETAWLLMHGEVICRVGQQQAFWRRQSLFDEGPSCLHVSAGHTVFLQAIVDSEVTVYACANQKPFKARFYDPVDVQTEHRGRGLVGNACYRHVRTIFDGTCADKNADLVLGEVVTLPGRWSSYPPHHHAQPELYHYRFTRPQGFGFSQLGDAVFRVCHGDTVSISPGEDHAQVAAPGYGMYYAWVVLHLPGNRYTKPEFSPEHAWTLDASAAMWQPRAKNNEDDLA